MIRVEIELQQYNWLIHSKKYYMANYLIQHIIEYWITNDRGNYGKLLPCEHM